MEDILAAIEETLRRIADALEYLAADAQARREQERTRLAAQHAKLKVDFDNALRIFEADQRKYDQLGARPLPDTYYQSDRLEQRLNEAEDALRTFESEHAELVEVQS